jgi:hypothetical protein
MPLPYHIIIIPSPYAPLQRLPELQGSPATCPFLFSFAEESGPVCARNIISASPHLPMPSHLELPPLDRHIEVFAIVQESKTLQHLVPRKNAYSERPPTVNSPQNSPNLSLQRSPTSNLTPPRNEELLFPCLHPPPRGPKFQGSPWMIKGRRKPSLFEGKYTKLTLIDGAHLDQL